MPQKHILQSLRSQIDTIDEEIVYLLSRRCECVKQIGNIKKEIGETPLQVDRWEKVLNNLYAEAEDKNVNKELIKKIWTHIHEESLRLES